VEVAILLGNVMVETMMFDVESRKVFRRLVAGLAASLEPGTVSMRRLRRSL
jgi:hypothetical protein